MDTNIATFKGLSKSKKSAKVFVKKNEFHQGHGVFGFMAPEPFKEMKVGETIKVPAGWATESRSNEEGEVMAFENEDGSKGDEMKFFVWN